MTKHTNPLDSVRVAAPCPADWEKMAGDERVRFCGQCSLHVYNLSGMSRREAEALVANTEGRLCVRFYRRADGTILTRNCPVGLRALKRRVGRVARAALSAALGFCAGLGLNFGFGRAGTRQVMGGLVVSPQQGYAPRGGGPVRDEAPVASTMGVVHVPTPAVPGGSYAEVGELAVSPNAGYAPKAGPRRHPKRPR